MRKRSRIVLSLLALVVVAGIVGLVILLHHGFRARDEPSAIEGFLATQMRDLAVPTSARALRNPVQPSEEILAEARAHFADHCASCHGNDGKGQTAMGRNLYPRAPDMTASRTQSKSEGEIFYTIKNGVRLSGMPAWGEDTPEDDRASWELVHFIRHLPSVTPEELETMERMNPKSPDEWKEQEDTRRFLEGDVAPSEHAHGDSETNRRAP
jgi:mono/diheme cytochrome c family protein